VDDNKNVPRGTSHKSSILSVQAPGPETGELNPVNFVKGSTDFFFCYENNPVYFSP
jgi:hypothetical protein